MIIDVLSFLILLCSGVVQSRYFNAPAHENWSLLDHEKCGLSASDRMIGGTNAGLGSHPWLARLGYVMPTTLNPDKVHFLCGGALINKLYVLTTAHCVAHLRHGTKLVSIVLGEYNTESDPDCIQGYCADLIQNIKPDVVIVHAGFNPDEELHDISLIRLSHRAKINAFVRPICLPHGSLLHPMQIGKTAELAGWGYANPDVPTEHTVLQAINLAVVNMEKCREAFRNTELEMSHNQICAGGVTGQNICHGDNGGPLIEVSAMDGTPRSYVMGLSAYQLEPCGRHDAPALFVSVGAYIVWILDNISP